MHQLLVEPRLERAQSASARPGGVPQRPLPSPLLPRRRLAAHRPILSWQPLSLSLPRQASSAAARYPTWNPHSRQYGRPRGSLGSASQAPDLPGIREALGPEVQLNPAFLNRSRSDGSVDDKRTARGSDSTYSSSQGPQDHSPPFISLTPSPREK